MPLLITSDDLNLIRADGESGYPEEVCGFLYGLDNNAERVIHAVVPVDNQQRFDRNRRFLITPDEFRRAEADARARGLDLLGFYHSHPDHPAIPSEFDREHALPLYSYIIVSIQKGVATDVRSWLLNEDRAGYAAEQIQEKAVLVA
jgi:proteasome lid subunit RPN8/RPN11